VSLVSLPIAFALEGHLHFTAQPEVLFGLAYLAILSSGVAFTLQLVAQKRISPGVAAMIFLLEAPFGAICGALFDGDRLSNTQWAGAGLMTVASLLAIRA
jgi:drug/metabolite transporter (DMT)-like permease